MKLTLRALALTAAVAFVGATVAAACPGHDAAKAKATNASTTGATKVTATNASNTGCNKATATNASNTGCSKATNASNTGCAKKSAGCCAKGGAVAAATGSKVALEGIVQCAHCDLKTAEHCATILKTADGRMINLAKSDKVMSLREEAPHGSKLVRVKGVVGEDGVVTVSTFKVLGDAPAPSAAGV